jgi:hypothetical protein
MRGSDPTPADSGTRRLTGIPLLIVALCVVLFVQALFVTSYIGALHHPKPHRVPLGVVGSSPLPAAVGKAFSLKLRQYPSEGAALAAIDHRKIDGAFVAAPGGDRLVVVPASGNPGASALTAAFGAAAAALKQPLEVVQVHKLPPTDASGSVSFFVVMALIVGGYLSATIALAFGGATTTRQRRLLALGIVAVFGALITDLVAGPGLGAIPTSKFFTLWGLFVLVMMAVAYAAAGLQALLGAAGTLVVVVLFVIFGAPASGGTIPSPYLPTLWRTFGPYLPAGAGTTAVRNTIYFDGNAITKPLLVLAAYLVVGAAAVIVVRRRSRSANAETEAEASAGVGAVVV